MSTKKYDGHVRISTAERTFMEKFGIGFSRVWRVGLDTLKMWIQGDSLSSCSYLYNTGKNRAAPGAASLPPSGPSAQGCPCPACPIRAAFGQVPHERCGQKENVESATQYPILKR
jgi:hypothetical protein